jgi:hypothetical protein
MEALPPYLWDLSLLARIAGFRSEPGTRSVNPGPEPALELRPRIALSSVQVSGRVAELDAVRQHRTFHLLIKPDILTCYQHLLSGPRREASGCTLLDNLGETSYAFPK